MKRVWKAKEVIKGWEGKPIRVTKPDEPFDSEDTSTEVCDMTVFDAMLVVANLSRVETLDDSSKKKTLKQSLKESQQSGEIELEAEVYKWLKAASEKVSPLAWQDNANEVHDILTEGFKKENEPSKSAAKKAAKEEADDKATKESGQSEDKE